MPKFKVMLARLSRATKVVEVYAESKESIDLRDVYENSDEEEGWYLDADWGVEEGTHVVLEDS